MSRRDACRNRRTSFYEICLTAASRGRLFFFSPRFGPAVQTFISQKNGYAEFFFHFIKSIYHPTNFNER